MSRVLLIGTALLASFLLQAQNTLSLPEYLSIIKKYHPVARQAALGIEIAKAEVLSSRGAFDPVVTHEKSRKEFGGLLYYDAQLTELRVPTWYGIEVTSGLESLSGARTSTPETKGNSSYFGFSVPVGKGLLMDRRRADLQTVRIFQQLSYQEQSATLNDLFFEAAQAYWNWWQQVQVQALLAQATRAAEQRFELVKTTVRLGDRAAIDTVEALAQLQSFRLRAVEVAVALANARLELEAQLWTQGGEPYTLPKETVPLYTMPSPLPLDNLLQSVGAHPELLGYRFKLNVLEVERRLKFQSLLPSVYLKYNQLTASHNLAKTFSTPWLQNNYRYGLAVSVPLRFSEGRGEYRQAKLKIEQTVLAASAKRVALQTKLQQYYNEWSGVQTQLSLQRAATASYAALQRAEEVRFNNGESSLFLINARELKTLEASEKEVELQSKEGKAVAAAYWAAGILTTALR
jgi:outer membrane protein TolC